MDFVNCDRAEERLLVTLAAKTDDNSALVTALLAKIDALSRQVEELAAQGRNPLQDFRVPGSLVQAEAHDIRRQLERKGLLASRVSLNGRPFQIRLVGQHIMFADNVRLLRDMGCTVAPASADHAAKRIYTIVWEAPAP